MKLGRWGQRSFTKSEDSFSQYSSDENREVLAIFNHFGRGSQKDSKLYVAIEWNDIERLISEFAEMGEPAAIALQQARSLAKATRRAGWVPKISN